MYGKSMAKQRAWICDALVMHVIIFLRLRFAMGLILIPRLVICHGLQRFHGKLAAG